MFKNKWNRWILNKENKYSKKENFFNIIISLSLTILVVSTIVFLIMTKDFKTPKNISDSLKMKLPKSVNIIASVSFISFGLLILSLIAKVFYWNKRKRKNYNEK